VDPIVRLFHLVEVHCIMLRTLGAFLLGSSVWLASAAGADDQKTEIKGGIDGHIVKVDVEGKKLTIATAQGRERTFTITEETTMFGPRGGKVKKHLRDPRFREGFAVTIVADGNTADEVHFGFAKDATGYKGEQSTSKPAAPADRTKIEKSLPASPASPASTAKDIAKHKEATKLEEEDDEEEIPGHIKTFDATRRMLVLTLFNGKTRSFILAHDVPVHIKGEAAASSQGLTDPQLKSGAFVTVVTDEGGRKVKELVITPASQLRKKKAG
jgi:hypothetical protein